MKQKRHEPEKRENRTRKQQQEKRAEEEKEKKLDGDIREGIGEDKKRDMTEGKLYEKLRRKGNKIIMRKKGLGKTAPTRGDAEERQKR